GRAKHMVELLDMATAWFHARSADQALEALRAHDIPHSPIMSMADIFKDPHYRERETIIEVPSEVGPLPQPAVIPRLSATPGRVRGGSPPGSPPRGAGGAPRARPWDSTPTRCSRASSA